MGHSRRNPISNQRGTLTWLRKCTALWLWCAWLLKSTGEGGKSEGHHSTFCSRWEKTATVDNACFYENRSSRLFGVCLTSQDSPSYEVCLLCLHGCVTTTHMFLISETDGMESAPDPCQSQEKNVCQPQHLERLVEDQMCENTFCREAWSSPVFTTLRFQRGGKLRPLPLALGSFMSSMEKSSLGSFFSPSYMKIMCIENVGLLVPHR